MTHHTPGIWRSSGSVAGSSIRGNGESSGGNRSQLAASRAQVCDLLSNRWLSRAAHRNPLLLNFQVNSYKAPSGNMASEEFSKLICGLDLATSSPYSERAWIHDCTMC